MDAAVGNKLVQSQTADFTTHGVETGNNDSLRSVVDDDFHTTGSFQGAYVAAFASDDTAFDFVIVNVEHTYGVFHGSLGGYALDGLYDDFLSLLIGVELGFVHNLIDIGGGIHARLVFQALHQACLCFFGTESGEFFKLGALLTLHFLQFSLAHLQKFLFIVDALLLLLDFLLAPVHVFLTLIQ